MSQNKIAVAGPTCSCAGVKIGGTPTGSINLNYECLVHGLGTEWFEESRKNFATDSYRRRVLVEKAKAASETGVSCSTGERFEDLGVCAVCDSARRAMDDLGGYYGSAAL